MNFYQQKMSDQVIHLSGSMLIHNPRLWSRSLKKTGLTKSSLSLSLSVRFNGHLPVEPGLRWYLLKQRMMKVVVTIA